MKKKALALTMAALTAAGMIAGCGSAPAAATPESAEGGAAAQQQEEQGQAAESGEVVELTMWGGWSGDQIAQLEEAGEVDRFIFGFEESYGYLAGPYVRDKDAVIGSMLICEMAAYYRSIGSSLKQRMEEIYAQYGRYLNKVDSFEFPGLSGMDKMAGIMQGLRENPLTEVAGYKVVSVTDYTKPEETGLPSANVLIYKLENNETVIVRPSGTEPKIKIYYTTLGKDLAEAQAEKDKLAEALKPVMA